MEFQLGAFEGRMKFFLVGWWDGWILSKQHIVLGGRFCAPQFLPARRYASAGLCDSDVSVRPDVCHTPVLCLAERKQDVKCTPSDSPMTLVSGNIWVVEKFARGHPKGTCQMRVGWVFSAIFDQYVVISRKRCILDTKLLWDGNRKPYASYRIVSVSMTLSDPDPGFKVTVVSKREYLQSDAFYRHSYYIGRNRTPQARYR